MDKTRYQLFYDEITQSDLENARSCFKTEELTEMNRKMNQILSCTKFANFESQAAAEKAFILGYLAAHILYPEEHNT